MPPKKVGVQGLAIRSQGREIISNVTDFMKKEAEEGITIPIKNHRARTLAATKISKATYQKICKEALQVEWSGGSTSFTSPSKKRPRKAPKLDNITPSHIKNIREIIYDFYILEKRMPTSKCIVQKIRDEKILPFEISITSLSKLLKKIGFRWQRTNDNQTALMENYDTRLKRINYLKKIKEYRDAGRNIIYADETYIYSSHNKEMGLNDDTSKPKGQKLIIVHAGGELGFIEAGLLIFRSGTKSGDYRDDMNHENFMKWVTNQLLPNMPENSVLVVDNASYHNVPVEKQISIGSLKTELLEWLEERNIPVDETLTKAELYKIIKENKFRFPIKYKLDELLHQHGHCVLRLPSYHPELNPIEKVWATIKNWVASQNTTFRISDVEALAIQKVSGVTPEEWRDFCDQVKTHEIHLMEKEHLFDAALEDLKFSVNTGSSEESDSQFSSDGESISDWDQ